MKKSIILLLTITVLSSCTSTRKVLDSWMGSTKQNLIISWGPPQRVFDNSPNGEILVYAKQVYIAPTTYYYGNNPTTIVGQNYWNYTYMYINTESKVYYWRTEKQQVPPQQIDLYIRRI